MTGHLAGAWTIDPARTTIAFSVKHLMVDTVRGTFRDFTGRITTTEDPANSSVQANINTQSLDTAHQKRDAATHKADVFAAHHHPEMTFDSRHVVFDGGRYVVDGTLGIRGVQRPVSLPLDRTDFRRDEARFTARTTLKRHDFGVRFPFPLDLLLSNTVHIRLDITATRQD